MVLKYAVQEMDDNEIVRAFQGQGDRNRAATALYEKYYDRLFLHSLYIVHSREEAQDIAQEVLAERFHKHIGTLAESVDHGELKLQAWLYRVTTNLSFNLIRDRKRRNNILAREPISREYDADYIGTVFRGQRKKTILETMEYLTDDHREILTLRYYEDLSYLEIVDRLGIKLGTVMSRLSRARNRLEEMLEE